MTDTTQRKIEYFRNLKIKTPEHKRAEKEARMIELTLEAFGIQARVVEINMKKSGFEYRIEISVGTSIESVEKLDRDIAMAVSSPTGKVKIQAPIPGTSYIGILVPPGKPAN